MPTINGKTVSAIPGLYVKSRNKVHDAVVQLDNVNTAPTTTTGKYYLYVDAGVLKYDNGSSTVSLTGASSGTIPSWETVFVNDATFALTSGTWTISQSSANAIMTLNKTNVGAGAVIDITNSGTGSDIKNSTNWSIKASGGVGVLELGSTGSVNATDGALSVGKTGTATTLLGTATIAEGFTVTSGHGVLSSGNLTLTSGNLVATLGNVTVTNGITSLTSTSNVAAGVAMINNTVTTYGAATASGAVEISSTSLTTGTLLHLELTEGTLNGGYYMRAWDVTAGAAVFSVAEDGATVIAGTLAGTPAITLTTGDFLASSGDLTLSNGSLVVTNTANEAAMTVVADTVSTGIALDINADGLTSGTILHLDTTVAGMTTGLFIDCYDGAASAFSVGKYGAVVIAGNAGTTVATVTAGDLLVSDGSLAITDADEAETVTIVNNTVQSAAAVSITANAITDGDVLKLVSSAAGMTTGNFLQCYNGAANVFEIGLYGAVTVGGNAGSTVFTITAGDAVLSDGSLALTDADEAPSLSVTNNTVASDAAVVFTANGVTDGDVLKLVSSAAGMTTGNFLQCYNGAANVFEVGLYGAVTIAGNAGTNVLTVTAGHLVLTSGNAVLTSGNLTLTSGNATLTAGNITLTNGSMIETPQAIVNANTAIDVTHGITTIANNGASTHTLADGTVGQIKRIVCTVYAADAVITPANLANGSTITLNAVGDACTLVFLGTEWWVTSLYGTTALA